MDLIPLAQTHDTWLDDQRSPETRRAYTSDLQQFKDWYSRQGIADVTQASKADIVAYRKYLESLGRANSTIARKLATLSMAFRVAIDEELMSRNPAAHVKRPHVSDESPRNALDDQTVRKILAQPNRSTQSGSRDYAILMVLFHLGLRRAEVAKLNLGSFAKEQSMTVVRVQGKGERVRKLPVVSEVEDAIMVSLARSGRSNAPKDAPLFVSYRANGARGKGSRLTGASVWDIVIKSIRAAGYEGVGIDVHTLRHTAITNAHDHGADIVELQEFAGHANISTTRRYVSQHDALKKSAAWKIEY